MEETEIVIESKIFGWFRERKIHAGGVLPFGIWSSRAEELKPKEKEVFDAVLKGLIYRGLIEYYDTLFKGLRLTQRGEDRIYSY
jgi:hypothetical protein